MLVRVQFELGLPDKFWDKVEIVFARNGQRAILSSPKKKFMINFNKIS